MCRSAVTDAKRIVLSTVQHGMEGTWTVTEWSKGRIELRRDDKNDMFQEIYDESMRLCRLRLQKHEIAASETMWIGL